MPLQAIISSSQQTMQATHPHSKASTGGGVAAATATAAATTTAAAATTTAETNTGPESKWWPGRHRGIVVPTPSGIKYQRECSA